MSDVQLSFGVAVSTAGATDHHQRAEWAAGAFLASYRAETTRRTYSQDLRTYLGFLQTYCPDVDPIYGVRRAHVDTYARWLEDEGRATSSVARCLSVVTSWYRYLQSDELIDKNPAAFVKRPKVPRESTRAWLTRNEMQMTLDLAEQEGGYPYALLCLLADTALRISEACGADVTDLGTERHHHTLKIMGKGGQPAVIALPPRTIRAIEGAIGDRERGPLLLTRNGTRMNRESAGRICRRFTTAAGIAKPITPHSLRHSSITGHIRATRGDAEATRQFARHADLRTTQRYIRGATRLDAAGSYVVSAWFAGGE